MKCAQNTLPLGDEKLKRELGIKSVSVDTRTHIYVYSVCVCGLCCMHMFKFHFIAPPTGQSAGCTRIIDVYI